MKLVCCGILYFNCLLCFGQLRDDFSDNNFTSSPEWKGDTHSFTINDQRLQSNGVGAGTSYLSTTSKAIDDAIWEFEVELSFNPSSQNFCRVYLASDSPDLSKALKGYYLQVGGSKDQITLCRQDLDQHQPIIQGPEGMTDSTFTKVAVVITRSSQALWTLEVTSYDSTEPELLGSAHDHTFSSAHFFGVWCKYTVTRSKGFFFDNIQVKGTAKADLIPPQVLALNVIDQFHIELVLNEPVKIPTTNQFSIEGLGNPSQVILSAYNSWQLSYPGGFEHGKKYDLEIGSLEDLAGNKASHTLPFCFWEIGTPSPYDVIITEIMADPSPALQLPEQEYLELYNASDSALNLFDWELSDATKSVHLPHYLLAPQSYVVLGPQNLKAAFPGNSAVIPVAGWPSLNNSEDLLMLTDTTGKRIHSVNYNTEWYRDHLKHQGGWSLEMIDVNYPCSGAQNWAASTSMTGGTPGRENSIATDNPDLTPPQIIRTLAISPELFSIEFDQALGQTDQLRMSIEPILSIDSIMVKSLIEPEITVRLSDPMKPGVVYRVSIEGLSDCNGNIELDSALTAQVGLPQQPDSGDVVINEVLFNPRPFGVRFVEVFNRSGKVLDLKNWQLARWQSGSLTNFTKISDYHLPVYPDEIKVFTTDPGTLQGQYNNIPPSSLVKLDALPSLTDREGSVVIVSNDGAIMDDFRYHKDMHHPLLTSQEGVSLERVSPHLVTNDPNSWHSGAESKGYASPGVINSQYFENLPSSKIVVQPRLISPNSSQLPVYTRIVFQMDKPGNTGSVFVFNRYGYRVKTLVNNSLLPTQGAIKWDGTNLNGQPVPMGYYIILFQTTTPDGSIDRFTETVVVASGF